jgi:hypothetical protein
MPGAFTRAMRISWVVLSTLLVLPALAHADQPAVSEEATRTGRTIDGVSLSGSTRGKAQDWMIMPSGTATAGGTLAFVTAERGMGDTLKFTDVVMTSVNARVAFRHRFELAAGATFLPKQPSFTDELLWQSASLGARVGFGDRYAAFVTGAGGVLLDDRGMWAGADVGLQARKSLHRTLLVEGTFGGSGTSLFEDQRDQAAWLTEVVTGGELIFRDPFGTVAGWVGTEFRFPVAHDSMMSNTGEPAYDPQTRVNFYLGGTLSYIDNWDIYAQYAFIDRGDAIDPRTTLPILAGGFDQQQIVIGVTHVFHPENNADQSLLIAR